MHVDHMTRSPERSGAANSIRILVFDCWLPGFLYVRHLADTEGVSLTFVHNSERQLGTPAREYKDFKERLSPPDWVKDFGDYDHRFATLFDTEKPDVVLVTSMHYLECRSALLFAADRGVMRAFIPHGIFLLDRSKVIGSPKSVFDRVKRLLEKLPRAVYYGRFFWSAHFQRERDQRGSFLAAFSCFLDLLSNYSNWQWAPSPQAQRYYARLLDIGIVYDAQLAKYYSQNLGAIVDGTEFKVSGTLDSGKLRRALSVARKSGASARVPPKVAYYVSSPYPEDFSASGARALADLLMKLQSLVQAAGCERLIYRPHPGEPSWFVDAACVQHGIECDMSRDLSWFISASLVCGTSSSLLYNAIILSKPILTVSSEKFKMDAPYYEPLISYPRIAVDLDRAVDVLIEENREALVSALRRSSTTPESAVSDPVEVLLETVRSERAS